MTNPLSFLATCPMGLGTLLVDELTELGATQVRETPAGVFFSGPLAVAYRACLWSRLANRILLKLSDTAVASTDDVYAAARSLRWSDHMTPRANELYQEHPFWRIENKRWDSRLLQRSFGTASLS